MHTAHLHTMPPAPGDNASRYWCFTLNNYTDEDQARLRAVDCTYLIFGREVGEQGTPHLQGFVITHTRIRLAQVKVLLGTDRVHVEKARGSPEQADDYCKKDGDFECIGTPPARRKRTRDELAVEFRDAIRGGGAGALVGWADANPGVYAFSGHNLVRNHQSTIIPVRRENVTCTWIVGPSGSGKSHAAWEKYPDAFSKEPRHKWWSGYLGEKHVIIDDFGKDNIDITYLLRWFDKYPVSIETKGGQMGLLATDFVVTSNFLPSEIYQGHPQLQALLRRINIVEKTARHEPVWEVIELTDDE